MGYHLVTDKEYATAMDQSDPLGKFRDQFYIPQETIYLDGNSLGLASKPAEAALLRSLAEWKERGIGGWLDADPPWYWLGERLGAKLAPLVGADPASVIVAGSTTVNLHALLATFFPGSPTEPPKGTDGSILADELNFPSDLYAIESFLKTLGLDPSVHLRLVKSSDGRTLKEEDVVAAMDQEDVSVAVLPSVLYRSGQLLDMERLTIEAQRRGVIIGFDCSHSVGAVPHYLDRWGVDFAFWCNYKYLNGGPGATAAVYVNQRHHAKGPGLAGWWGSDKERQFDMAREFVPAKGAGAWQLGTIPVFSTAAIEGALEIHLKAGIEAIRGKSLRQTRYLIELIDALQREGSQYRVGAPREDSSRGGHVAVEHPQAARISRALRHRGVIPDFRPPNIIRLAPSPLYTSYREIWDAVQSLATIERNEEWTGYPENRDTVS